MTSPKKKAPSNQQQSTAASTTAASTTAASNNKSPHKDSKGKQPMSPQKQPASGSTQQQKPTATSSNNNIKATESKPQQQQLQQANAKIQPQQRHQKKSSVIEPKGLFDAYDSEPPQPPRKLKQGKMPPGSPTKHRSPPPEIPDYVHQSCAFKFTLPSEITTGKTNKQLKAKIRDELHCCGIIDEIRMMSVGNDENGDEADENEESSEDKQVHVLFARLLHKGGELKGKIEMGESAKLNLLEQEVEVLLSEAKPSGGGKSTGTDKKQPERQEANIGHGGRGGGRGARRGGRGRGRGQ